MDQFKNALENNSLELMSKIEKSDIHNHAGRGGHRCYLNQNMQLDIQPPDTIFESLDDMQCWFDQHVKSVCSGKAGYIRRIEAAFHQAKADHIKILALGFGIGEIDQLGGMKAFIDFINKIKERYAPETEFFPELSLGRESNNSLVLERVKEILDFEYFHSIDICNNELAQPIKNFQKIYLFAEEKGLKLKAHVGEFGTAEDVKEAVETLGLQEVHHGIAASQSVKVMRFLSENKIQLNICPTSNIMLNRVKNYENHPIRILYDHGIPVTINTDDLLIFDKSISEEYLILFNSGVFTAEELNNIRMQGLRSYMDRRKT